ncbi:MAG: hypothetical protein HUU31_25480 [Anaerolineae bacterium]|nr:hypothetical protein [Anaerolineae bacterium]
MTWGQLASLVAYKEGHSLLLGDESGTFGNPQVSGLGVCWRRAAGEWHQGEVECNVTAAPAVPGVQNDFVYAVWEWMLKECATYTGFTDSNGYPDYEKDGEHYRGQCNEAGLTRFLMQVQSLYQDTGFDGDANRYLARMQTELALWGWGDGTPIRYRYGICPCTWGNVETQDQARVGNPGVNGGNSFSYFHWNSEVAPNPILRYFKIY